MTVDYRGPLTAAPSSQPPIGDRLAGPLVCGLIGLMALAFALLRGPLAMPPGNELTVDRAAFAVVNAATLGGFRLSVAVNDYKPLGQTVIFTLILASSAVYLLVGGWSIVRITRAPYSDWQIVRAVAITITLALLIGAIVLMDRGGSAWPGTFQAASALGNAGQTVGAVPSSDDWRTHLLLLPLSMVGGLGAFVVLDLVNSVTHARRPQIHTSSAIVWTAATYLAAFLVVFAIQSLVSNDGIRRCAMVASVEVCNARTLGMPFNSFEHIARAAQWVLLLVMALGAATGGTGGGIKLTTLALLAREANGPSDTPRRSPMLGIALSWIGAYVGIVLFTAVLLAVVNPAEPGERVLWLAVSAASNVGTTPEPLTTTGPALYVLGSAMLLGRFVPLAILWRAARSGVRSDIAPC